jgi:putative transposase
MRRSQFTESEILHLLYEAASGVPVAEISATAGVSLRTFYRWRRRYGGLNAVAVTEMKDLAVENIRLKGLVSSLFERLRATPDAGPPPAVPAAAPSSPAREREQRRAIGIAAEKCGGALTGRFASVRVNP